MIAQPVVRRRPNNGPAGNAGATQMLKIMTLGAAAILTIR